MREQMTNYASNLEFEMAQEVKERISKIEGFQSKSAISTVSSVNVDVFSILEDEDKNTSYVNYLKVVNGSVIQSFTMEFRKRLDETKEEIFIVCHF